MGTGPQAKLNRRGFLFAAGAAVLGEAPGSASGQGIHHMNHIVLLGDSIFDNAYVAGGPDVVRQERDILPGWHATLQARDGALIAELAKQLQRVPADPSHLVVSVGGNEALGEAEVRRSQGPFSASRLQVVHHARLA